MKLEDYFAFVDASSINDFKFVIGNRELDSRHVNKLKTLMSQNPESVWTGILVNKRTNVVLDGQHRIAARKEFYKENPQYSSIPLGITYVDVPEEDQIQFIIQVNTNSLNWSMANYINCYAKRGNKSYQRLVDFSEKNDIPFRYAIAIIKGRSCNQAVKDGKFYSHEIDFKVAEKNLAELKEIYSDILNKPFGGTSLEAIGAAYSQFRNPAIDFEEFKEKLRGRAYSLSLCTKVKEAKEIFEDVIRM